MFFNNSYPIKGVIHEIKRDEIPGKKDPTRTFEKYLITLAITESVERKRGDNTGYISETQYPQFEAFDFRGADLSSFHVGDLVEITFTLKGKKLTYSKGPNAGKEFIKNSSTITKIRYADLDAGYANNKGKVSVMPDTKPEAPILPEPQEDDGDLPF